MVALGLSQIGGLTVYAFSPGQLDVFAQPVAGGFAPIAPSDILAASGAVAALDGPQFENCSGQNLPYGNASYAQSQCGYPQFLVQGSAIAHPGSRPNEGHTLSVVGGQVSIAQGAQVAPGASVAVQLWPPLVIDSQVVASNIGSNSTVERRAALAVLPGGMLAFIVGSDDMYGFASSIQALGATFAGYTDGGGSAALVPATGGSRPVPTWLIARAGGGSIMGPILGALILGGIAAGILYATLKIKPRSNPTAIQDDLGIRTTEDAIRYVERQSEPKGWPGDVEIVTIPFAEHLRTIRTEKDRSVYPIRRIPVRSLRITQPVVDRALVIQLLRSGWSEPILVSSRGEILDGHHRAYAASLRGDPYILARVVPAARANPSNRDQKLQLWRWVGKRWIAEGIEVERGLGANDVVREFEQRFPGVKFDLGFKRPNRPPAPDDVFIDLSNGARIWIGALQTFPFKPRTDRPYDFHVSYIAPRLHGPGTGRGAEYIDENGEPSHERVLFKTQRAAIVAAEKFAKR